MSIVLLVEDEPLELEFLQSIAAEAQPTPEKILTCQNGRQAVKLAHQYRPDAIVMDIHIPEMDGLQALQEIKTFLPQACVAILSAYSEFSYAQTAIRLRVQKYMLKPIKPAVFRRVFQDLLAAAARRADTDTTDAAVGSGLGTALEMGESPSDQIALIEKSKQYIHDNFKQKLSLATVAAYVYLNPQYFNRVFVQHMQMPPKAYRRTHKRS